MDACTSRQVRVLHIGQDDLFGQVPGIDRRFIPTGNSITPPACRRSGLSLNSLFRLLAGLAAPTRFDTIVLPAVQFDWPHDPTRLKRLARRLTSRVATNRVLSAPLNRLLRSKSDHIVALDRFDSTEISTSFIASLSCLNMYFKTNLNVAEQEHRTPSHQHRNCPLRFLPYWIATEHYPDPGQLDKDIDLLFMGALNSVERIEGHRVLESMRSQGYRIIACHQRVPFQQYQQLTARAWLTLSPQGFGYNGFRHYEAMLLRSVPVINLPHPPVMHDFVDGENCFLYSPALLRERLEQALANRDRLAEMSSRIRDFALARHSFQAVGRYLLKEIAVAGRDPSCTRSRLAR